MIFFVTYINICCDNMALSRRKQHPEPVYLMGDSYLLVAAILNVCTITASSYPSEDMLHV